MNPYRITFYSLLLYSFLSIFPKSLCASEKISTVPLLNYTGDLRVLNVDLESLDSKEPIIPELFQTVKKDLKQHPAYASQNNFVLGYLSQLQDKDEEAHKYFQEIQSDDPMYGTTLYFDGISLRKIGEAANPKDKEKNCKNSIDELNKVSDLTPDYFASRQPKQLAISTVCYFEGHIDKTKFDVQEQQWFQNTLQSSKAFVEGPRRETLYLQYLDSVSPLFTDQEKTAYLEFGLSLFPKNPRLLAEAQKNNVQLPATPIEAVPIEKTEVEQQKIFQDAKSAQQKNDIKLALQKYSEIITKYPDSFTGEKSKQEIMALMKNEAKWNRNTNAYNEELKKLPPELMFDIAKYLWNQDYNMTAYALYTQIIEKYPYFDKASEAYYSIARMHEDWSEWPKAIKFYTDIVEKYSRSKFFERSHFKVGFLYYMNGEYDKAIDWLAKEKNIVVDPHNKAQACYWLGRTYEKIKKKRDAEAQFDEVRQKYPLTYYSFILGIDPQSIRHDGLGFQNVKIEQNHPLYLPSIYLGVGLQKPARSMIQSYGNQNEEHLYQIVQLFHDTGFYVFAMPNALDLTEKTISKRGLQDELVRMIFPVKYFDLVEKESKPQQMDPFVVMSLIKQESGYFERAVSNANAVGLMQLLVPTAQVLAKASKSPLPEKDDLFNPDTNIKLGVEYLKNLNDQFNHDIVLVLSAYNAGPDRSVKWKNRWPNVRKDEFVELIPFSETRKYVKLILRNYSYYKFLIQNQNTNLEDFGFN